MSQSQRDDQEPQASSQPGSQEDYFSQAASSSTTTHQSKRLNALDPVRARLGAEPGSGSPTSPRTPRTPILGRSLSSAVNSPGQGFRADDEYFIFEIGSRYLRAGLGGESQPRCTLDFAPETQRRAGDYSQQSNGPKVSALASADNFESWGEDHILWHMDLRGVDLGLVEDKIERALRHAIVDYLLVLDDSKKRKFILSIPSIIPHPLLTTALSALFNVFAPPPSIILLSSPVLCSVSAGLRSALVVDIGWAGTTVSAIFEYREVQLAHSSRGMKLVSWKVCNLLGSKLQSPVSDGQHSTAVSFSDTEEVLNRMIWCRRRISASESNTNSHPNSTIDIPLKNSRPPVTISIPFQELSQPPEDALICSDETNEANYDDDELPLPLLLFKSLLSLPIDVRQTCQSRVVISGGGSNIPGLKARLLAELSELVSKRGWDPVASYGSAKNPKFRKFGVSNGVEPVRESTEPGLITNGHANKDIEPSTSSATHQQPPLPDPILATIRSKSSTAQPKADCPTQKVSEETDRTTTATDETFNQMNIQGAHSLGAWAGASLIGGLRIRGVVEIDREKFMQHGLPTGIQAAAAAAAASKRQSMAATSSQRQSLVGGSTMALGKSGDRESGIWTLGAWA